MLADASGANGCVPGRDPQLAVRAATRVDLGPFRQHGAIGSAPYKCDPGGEDAERWPSTSAAEYLAWWHYVRAPTQEDHIRWRQHEDRQVFARIGARRLL